MQQCDALRGRSNGERAARRQAPERVSVAGDFSDGIGAIQHPHFDDGFGANDDGSIRQGVRADRRNDEDFEIRIHDWAAARERIGRRARRTRHDEAIATVRVDEATIDPSFVIDEATDLARLQHDVVECETGLTLAIVGGELGREQRARVARASSFDRIVYRGQHVFGHHVGEEAEPAAIDAEQRGVGASEKPSGMQQGAIAADRDDEISVISEHVVWDEANREIGQTLGLGLECENLDLPFTQMTSEQGGAFGDASIGEAGDESAATD